MTNELKGKVNYSVNENIAILEVDNPPVNPLSSGVRAGLSEYIAKANNDESIDGIILTGAGRSFIAGADISEFGQKPDGPDLHTALKEIEFSKKPVLAAINGTALGGGLETALVCNYRMGTNKAIVGLPEVNLGLLPGAGGTQRLPRLIGPSQALKMMIAGTPMSAKKALQQGVIDAISENSLMDDAIAFLQEKIGLDLNEHPKVRDKNEKVLEARGDDNVLSEAKALAAKTRRGQFAPGQIIACVEAAINEDDFDIGMKKESEYFLECLINPQREAMIHIFFGERAASKISDIPKETPLLPINSAGIVGSGTMGGGIAMNFANAGIPVLVLDQDEKNLERGMGVIEKNYQMMVDRGRMTQEQKDMVLGLITPTLSYEDLSDVDIAVEAVYENLELKQEIFKSLDTVTKDHAILASNTSGLDIDAIASSTKRPEKVVGTHFFSPANIMRLLEVVRGKDSSDETMATVMSIGKRMGKAAVVSLNAPGFIGNRMLAGYTYQANMLLLEGALPSQVDSALESFGMSMGPFRMMDLVGLDLGWRARKLANIETPLANKISDALCDQDRFGQKTSKGFYNYSEGSRAPNPAPENEDIYKEISSQNNIERRDISDQEIIDRCILALVNEGARILEEGVAQRSGDMDIVYINGYGFPIWRGGPMFYANQLGLAEVISKMSAFSKLDENFWKPAPLLQKLADSSGAFGEAPAPEERAELLSFNKANMGGV
ncbi:3-hydroxyacyl-CoA dehydrogenase NAD-binding domain-containing protein [Gammaproteobacteria bacterium]|nr:3-hydroxyacyl-CoA dehydrogenase NAD-binding domain-containing protein [Gammaproteobacteria bacterium]MDC0902309.1 3-hydroxyacyl-CoA dehydrogenase NAD-binding domain-containing protein [Gammaproteobacteria bacterium]